MIHSSIERHRALVWKAWAAACLVALGLSWPALARQDETGASPPPQEAGAGSDQATADESAAQAAAESAAESADEAAEDSAERQDATPASARAPRHGAPAGPFMTLSSGSYRQMIDAVMSTSIGKLCAQEEMKKAIELGTKRYEAKREVIEELVTLAEDLDVELDIETRMTRVIEELTDLEYDASHFYIYPPTDLDDDDAEPQFLVCVQFPDGSNEQILAAVAALGEIVTDSGELTRSKGSRKVGDVSVVEYITTADEPESMLWYFMDDNELWVGVFASDLIDKMQPVRDESAARESAIANPFFTEDTFLALDIDVATIVEIAREQSDAEERDTMEKWLDFFGVRSLQSVRMGIRADGDDFREDLLLELTQDGKGLMASMTPIASTSKGKGLPPSIPAVEPELMHMRGSFDTQKLLDALMTIPESDAETDEERADALAGVRKVFDVFDGGVSMLMAAPSFGMLPIPRMVFAFGITSDEAYQAALEDAKSRLEGIGFKDTEYKGATLTTVQIPNNPSPLIPCFTVVDGGFYLAESPITLRALVSSIRDGKESLGPVAAENSGDVFLCRYDTRQIFRLMYEKVLPLAQLGLGQMQRMMGNNSEPILSLAELPTPATVAGYLGEGLVRVTWTEQGLRATARSTLGDPITTVLASVGAPMAPMQMGLTLDQERAAWEERVCRARVGRIYEALQLHRTSFGGGKRFPASLGDLLSRGLIEDESVLVVPSDEEPSSIEYETMDGEIVAADVSYKYMPTSKLVVTRGELEAEATFGIGGALAPGMLEEIDAPDDSEEAPEPKTILLYELNRNAHMGRFVLTTDGDVYHLSEQVFQKLVSMK